ncbi:MAG: sugar ABC transporter ATP-binding protein [Eubacterium sp.]|nr:sugar ABC transporter ATP-binding protein [Eubacterium sp.]
MKEKAVLELHNIHKTFPGVKALQNVDFTLREGEIHALMGENGAGKSTLIKVITGVYEKEEGQIFLKGHEGEAHIHSPQDAQNLGISTVYQEITLCPNLTVAENMFIGRTKGQITKWRQMNKDTDKILKSLDIPARANQQLASCSLAVQQMVAIARAVDMECKVLILDEPTSSLDDSEVQKLFGLMRDLKAKGVGIIFVTHFLDQVYEVCDRITVLRDGKLVGEYEIEKLPRVQLVSKMLGKELDDLEDIKGDSEGYKEKDADSPLFEAAQLQSNAGIKPFDFYIKKGEVNGFTGLLGSGRSECVRAIFGADRIINGKMKKNGKEVKINKPLDAMKQGIAYLPEDRKRDGIVGDLSVRENLILAAQVLRGFFKPYSKAETYRIADEYIKLLDIKTASADTPIKSLSGGNQQKVIVARWLLMHPEYLILDEPTRGIDVGTKVDIQKLVLKLASEGMSITFISSETDEMLRTCSRLVVMRDRKVVGELKGDELTQSNIMKTIAGHAEEMAASGEPIVVEQEIVVDDQEDAEKLIDAAEEMAAEIKEKIKSKVEGGEKID